MSEHVLNLPSGETIPYQLERRARKTIGLRISEAGLVVHVPKRVSQSYLEALLLSKAHWIRQKLEARAANAVAPMKWEDGAQLHLLGNIVILNVKQDSKNRNVEYLPSILNVSLIDPTDQNAIARKVVVWYQKQALADFGRRIEILAAKLGVATPRLLLSNARSRWGSCNSKKEIRINWRLIQAPPHIINYVTAHELAHLKEMNHSAKFWATVESIFPEYKKAEKELKALSPLLHQI